MFLYIRLGIRNSVDYMSSRTRTKEVREHVPGLDKGSKYVVKSEAINMLTRTTREFASLSDARVITEPDYYWIAAKSKEVAPREVKPINGWESYEGRTFEGVPSIPGDFKDNKDGTFTQLRSHTDAAWEDRVYVSEQAAAKAAKGEGPLGLFVGRGAVFYYRRLDVYSGDWAGVVARVASVPQAQAGGEAATQKVDAALVSSFSAVVAKLDAATKAGVLEPSLVNISKEVLRRLE